MPFSNFTLLTKTLFLPDLPVLLIILNFFHLRIMENTVILGTFSVTDLLFAYFSKLSPVNITKHSRIPMEVSAHVRNEKELDST